MVVWSSTQTHLIFLISTKIWLCYAFHNKPVYFVCRRINTNSYLTCYNQHNFCQLSYNKHSFWLLTSAQRIFLRLVSNTNRFWFVSNLKPFISCIWWSNTNYGSPLQKRRCCFFASNQTPRMLRCTYNKISLFVVRYNRNRFASSHTRKSRIVVFVYTIIAWCDWASRQNTIMLIAI